MAIKYSERGWCEAVYGREETFFNNKILGLCLQMSRQSTFSSFYLFYMSDYKTSLEDLQPAIQRALNNEKVAAIVTKYETAINSEFPAGTLAKMAPEGSLGQALLVLAATHHFKNAYSVKDGALITKPQNFKLISEKLGDPVVNVVVGTDGKTVSFGANQSLKTLGEELEFSLLEIVEEEDAAVATAAQTPSPAETVTAAETTTADYEQLFEQSTETEAVIEEEVTVPEPEPATQTITGLDSIVLPTAEEEQKAPPSGVVVAPSGQPDLAEVKELVNAGMQGINEILHSHRQLTDAALASMGQIVNTVLGAVAPVAALPATVQTEEGIEDLD